MNVVEHSWRDLFVLAELLQSCIFWQRPPYKLRDTRGLSPTRLLYTLKPTAINYFTVSYFLLWQTTKLHHSHSRCLCLKYRQTYNAGVLPERTNTHAQTHRLKMTTTPVSLVITTSLPFFMFSKSLDNININEGHSSCEVSYSVT